MRARAIRNALTIDVEDYFQVSAFAPYIARADGDLCECRVERNVDRILAHLHHCRARANARRVPEIVRAMENLKLALRMRFGDSSPDPAVTRRVEEIIDRAASEIERI